MLNDFIFLLAFLATKQRERERVEKRRNVSKSVFSGEVREATEEDGAVCWKNSME